MTNNLSSLMLVIGFMFCSFVLGLTVAVANGLHLRNLGTLTQVEMLQCKSSGGNYLVVKAAELESPIMIYKSGRVLGLKQLHFEYVDTFGCNYGLEEVYNED